MNWMNLQHWILPLLFPSIRGTQQTVPLPSRCPKNSVAANTFLKRRNLDTCLPQKGFLHAEFISQKFVALFFLGHRKSPAKSPWFGFLECTKLPKLVVLPRIQYIKWAKLREHVYNGLDLTTTLHVSNPQESSIFTNSNISPPSKTLPQAKLLNFAGGFPLPCEENRWYPRP